MSNGEKIPRVETVTEFLAAVEVGKAVEFEIEPGHVLRSDLKEAGQLDSLKKRLEDMLEAERFGSLVGHEPEAAKAATPHES